MVADITIYKAPQPEKSDRLLQIGFTDIDFPENSPYADGCCYFAGPSDRSIAEEFHQSYREGILEVALDEQSYQQTLKPLEC